MTDKSDLEVIMGAIEYGRLMGVDVGHSYREFVIYYALGMVTGFGFAFLVQL